MFLVSRKEKMFFAEHLSLMIKGGMPISEALEILKKESKSRIFKKSLDDISKRILEGESLYKSLARHPRIFNKFFQSIVRGGEEGGTLEENLKYLASSLRAEYSLRKKIIGILIYPIIIIIIALIVVAIVTIFILPRLLKLFQALDVPLPLPTKILLGSGIFLQRYWFFVLLVILLYFLTMRLLKFIKFTKFYIDKRNLLLPLFGKIEKNRNLAEFSRTFSTLLKSGVPILESLDIAIGILQNEVYKKKLLEVRTEVERGMKISQGLKKFPAIFPLIFCQMVLIGERTGTLEESFLYLTNFYEEEVDSDLKNLSTMMEPFLLVLVGLFVAFVALSIITPIYQITTGLRVK